VSDISCDVQGSIEFLERTTSIERPFFQYDPITGREVSDGIGNSGVTVMGVDILPTEFPRESSEHFGNAVVGVVKELAQAKQRQDVGPGIDTALLAPHLVSLGSFSLRIIWCWLVPSNGPHGSVLFSTTTG
jgi:alpha-aminoadipic semialdehyde synthase